MIYVKSPEDAMNLYYFRKVGQSGENVTSDSPYFMCSRLLCDFLRTGERDLYTLLPCPSAPGSYSPTEQQSGRGCNNSIPSRDRNWQWKEKRGNCPSFNGWVSWETHSCHMEHVPSSLKEVRKEKPQQRTSNLFCTIAPMVYPQGFSPESQGKAKLLKRSG